MLRTPRRYADNTYVQNRHPPYGVRLILYLYLMINPTLINIKKLVLIICVVALASFISIRRQSSIRPFYQLAGTWKKQTTKGALCERWTKINDNEMHGQGFRIAGKDTAWDEQFKLIKKGNELFYMATVANQNGGQTVPFKLVSADNGTYVFSNPEHDYPQQVVYKLPATDSLHAWIDGKINGKQKRVNFDYVREK